MGLPPHPRRPLNGNPRPQAFREPEWSTNPKGLVQYNADQKHVFTI